MAEGSPEDELAVSGHGQLGSGVHLERFFPGGTYGCVGVECCASTEGSPEAFFVLGEDEASRDLPAPKPYMPCLALALRKGQG
ncbi:hypothetical protein GCM10009601_09790 [Streptomyces thermospinosisporus]|uniref:Uncharacterized protein n=1 Tax=Streptomyces thermospinosisporus TaxID=161482 RepID=A0ABP4JBG9_9ACTN